MDFCKFHDAKNANLAKNAGAILALPTGQGTNPNPDGETDKGVRPVSSGHG